MNRKVKYFLPFVALLGLVGCNPKASSSSSSSSTSTPITSPSSPSSPSTSTSDDVGTVNLALDLSSVQAGIKNPNLGDNWTSDFTYTYDKAIVLKKTTDFIMTPPFSTKKALDVVITGFLEKGATSDDKLTVSVQGIDKSGKVIEEATISTANIGGTKEAPADITVGLKNTTGSIGAIKIGLKSTGRATNFGINKLVVTSK